MKLLLLVALLCGAAAADPELLQGFIYNNNHAGGKFPYNHMSTIEQLGATATYVAAWQASEVGEGHLDQRILFSVSNDRGQSWTAPHDILPHNNTPLWGPALFYHPTQRRLYLYFSRSVDANCERATHSRCAPGGDILLSTSDDVGGTWSTPVVLLRFFSNSRGDIAKVTANKPIFVNSAMTSWIISFWQQAEQHTGIPARNTTGPPCGGVLLTQNSGETYTAQGFIHSVNYAYYTIEPSVAVVGDINDGTIVQYFRTENVGFIARSVSNDGGPTSRPRS